EDGTTANLNHPGTRAAIEWIYDAVHEHRIMTSPPMRQAGSADWWDNITNGIASIGYLQAGHVPIFDERMGKDGWGIAPLPSGPAGPISGFGAFSGYAINSK